MTSQRGVPEWTSNVVGNEVLVDVVELGMTESVPADAGRRTGVERGVVLLELELDVSLDDVDDDASAGGASVTAAGSMTSSSSGIVANGCAGDEAGSTSAA